MSSAKKKSSPEKPIKQVKGDIKSQKQEDQLQQSTVSDIEQLFQKINEIKKNEKADSQIVQVIDQLQSMILTKSQQQFSRKAPSKKKIVLNKTKTQQQQSKGNLKVKVKSQDKIGRSNVQKQTESQELTTKVLKKQNYQNKVSRVQSANIKNKQQKTILEQKNLVKTQQQEKNVKDQKMNLKVQKSFANANESGSLIQKNNGKGKQLQEKISNPGDRQESQTILKSKLLQQTNYTKKASKTNKNAKKGKKQLPEKSKNPNQLDQQYIVENEAPGLILSKPMNIDNSDNKTTGNNKKKVKIVEESKIKGAQEQQNQKEELVNAISNQIMEQLISELMNEKFFQTN